MYAIIVIESKDILSSLVFDRSLLVPDTSTFNKDIIIEAY